MKLLITGGAGYIGVWTTKKALEAGHQVIVVDKGLFPSGVEEIKRLPSVEFVQRDIRDDMPDVLQGVDCVIHLAGLSNDPMANFNPEANRAINTLATIKLAEDCIAAGVRRFIFASSASVYGIASKPKLTEEDEVNPIFPYSISKYEAELALLKMQNEIEIVILRQATVMGWSPRYRTDLVVNAMVESALTCGKIIVNAGGEALRPLIDVQDLAECHIRMAEHSCTGIFNVNHHRRGSSIYEGYVIASLALWIKKILSEFGIEAEVEGNWEAEEGRSYDTSSEKLRRTLNWEPSRGVRDAVIDILKNRRGITFESKNIEWLKALQHGRDISYKTGGILL